MGRTQKIIRTEIEIRIFVYLNQEKLDICSLLIDLKVKLFLMHIMSLMQQFMQQILSFPMKNAQLRLK